MEPIFKKSDGYKSINSTQHKNKEHKNGSIPIITSEKGKKLV
tara:strand:+ start:361 stop:486 length:126 start_codon:yes stop_codon:yes gene_type:complete